LASSAGPAIERSSGRLGAGACTICWQRPQLVEQGFQSFQALLFHSAGQPDRQFVSVKLCFDL
jgi:hypothetical protein